MSELITCSECSKRMGVATQHSPESHAVARQIEAMRQRFIKAISGDETKSAGPPIGLDSERQSGE